MSFASLEWGNKTCKELSLGYRPVSTVCITDPASEAFKRMQQNKVSGLAVVNKQGFVRHAPAHHRGSLPKAYLNSFHSFPFDQLVGAISTSDLRAIGYQGNLIDRLLLPIHEFWRKEHAQTQAAGTPKALHLPLHVITPESTVTQVFQLFGQTQYVFTNLIIYDPKLSELGCQCAQVIFGRQSRHRRKENTRCCNTPGLYHLVK